MPSRSRRSSSATASSSARRRAAGFTLLEVLVALAILGIGLGVVLPGLGVALRLRRDTGEHVRLAIAAERLLGELAVRARAPEGAEEGEDGGCRWLIEPVGDEGAAPGGERRGAALVRVRLTLTAPGGSRWELATLVPRGKPEAGP